MKVLFYRYNNICERDVLWGFRELGVEARELWHSDEGGLSGIVRRVTEALQTEPADFVFSIDFFPMVSESCRVLGLRYLSWAVDAPVLTLYSRQVANDCNRVFCFDSAQAAEIGALNPGHVFYLPLAAPVPLRQKAVGRWEAEHGRGCLTASAGMGEAVAPGISFVGSLYDEQCDYDRHGALPQGLAGYLEGAMQAGAQLHQIFLPELLVTEAQARAFRDHMPDFPALPGESFLTDRTALTQSLMAARMTCMERRRLITLLGRRFGIDLWTGSDTAGLAGVRNHGRANTASEMPAIFARSAINLNQTMRGIRTGVSLRVWDILACGGFCLTDAQSDLWDLLPVGEALEVYGSEEDLTDKVSYYLQHPKECREIAAEGLRVVTRRHSYPQRLLRLLELGLGD